MSTSGLIAIALGAVSNFILFNAASILSQDITDGFADLAAIIMVMLHGILLVVSLPFLMNALQEALPTIKIVLLVEAILNSLFMVAIIYYLPSATFAGYLVLGIILVLDLVPILMVFIA